MVGKSGDPVPLSFTSWHMSIWGSWKDTGCTGMTSLGRHLGTPPGIILVRMSLNAFIRSLAQRYLQS